MKEEHCKHREVVQGGKPTRWQKNSTIIQNSLKFQQNYENQTPYHSREKSTESEDMNVRGQNGPVRLKFRVEN